jgi:hypothetical protein
MPRQFNANPDHPAVSMLVKLHADIAGRIQANKNEAQKLQDDVRHVEAVIQMFDPAFSLKSIAPRRRLKPNPFFKRGTIFRNAVNVLRTHGEPMTVAAITDAVIIATNLKNPSEKQEVDLRAAIRSTLENNAGKVVERVGEAVPRWWRLKQ